MKIKIFKVGIQTLALIASSMTLAFELAHAQESRVEELRNALIDAGAPSFGVMIGRGVRAKHFSCDTATCRFEIRHRDSRGDLVRGSRVVSGHIAERIILALQPFGYSEPVSFREVFCFVNNERPEESSLNPAPHSSTHCEFEENP